MYATLVWQKLRNVSNFEYYVIPKDWNNPSLYPAILFLLKITILSGKGIRKNVHSLKLKGSFVVAQNLLKLSRPTGDTISGNFVEPRNFKYFLIKITLSSIYNDTYYIQSNDNSYEDVSWRVEHLHCSSQLARSWKLSLKISSAWVIYVSTLNEIPVTTEVQ